MTPEMYIAIGVIVLAAFLGAAIVFVSRRRTKTCPRCQRSLPRGASECPVCAQTPSPEEIVVTEYPRPAVGEPELTTTQGPLASQRFIIPPQGLSIGRHPDNDIRLMEELMVSRYHAVIALEQGQYVLYDRDSANGTWVNDQRAFRHTLMPGDRIQIWNSQFVYGIAGAPPPPPRPPDAAIPTPHIVGESFCGYTLESLIGRGGMSEVFRARTASGKIVAIKILQQTDPYLVDKFVQEGNQIGPLLRGHPNIVEIHKFGHSPDGRLYIVMEYIDGLSLRRSSRIPADEIETVTLVGQVCSALAFAHQNDVVHRDIKPENILVAKNGVAKVLDFGIAKLTSASTVTRDKIVGTPEYLSPEQARGEPVQPASDVYSLGIVLYEMLTGSVPFPRPRDEESLRAAIEVVRRHLEEEPEPVHVRNPQARVSRRLERVTMRALKKDLRERYATAAELGKALGTQEPISVQRSSVKPEPASLTILEGRRKGQRIPVTLEPVDLGRLELDPSDTTVSRHHATVSFRAGGYWLEDKSKNGTWVDDVRVYGEVPLNSGSVIVIGENVIRLEHESA